MYTPTIGAGNQRHAGIRATGHDTTMETRIITRDEKVRILTMTFSYVSSEESWDGIESFYSVGIDIGKRP